MLLSYSTTAHGWSCPSSTIMSSNPSLQSFWMSLQNALVLNASFYENIRNTPKNRQLALIIVGMATLSHMLGSAVILLINRASFPVLLLALFLDGLSVIVGYYFWTFAVFKFGQWLKPIHPTYQDLLSPIGVAYAPQVLNFLTLIPLLGKVIDLVLAVWSLLAVIVAVRQGLDLKTRWATLICLVGWIPIQFALNLVQLLEQELVQ